MVEWLRRQTRTLRYRVDLFPKGAQVRILPVALTLFATALRLVRQAQMAREGRVAIGECPPVTAAQWARDDAPGAHSGHAGMSQRSFDARSDGAQPVSLDSPSTPLSLATPHANGAPNARELTHADVDLEVGRNGGAAGVGDRAPPGSAAQDEAKTGLLKGAMPSLAHAGAHLQDL